VRKKPSGQFTYKPLYVQRRAFFFSVGNYLASYFFHNIHNSQELKYSPAMDFCAVGIQGFCVSALLKISAAASIFLIKIKAAL